MDTMTMFYVLYAMLLICITVLMFSMKYVKFALKLQLYKKKWGVQNVGLIFKRSLGNGFDLPEFVQLDANVKTTDKDINIYQRDQFRDGTFFGCPYMFIDARDTKTSWGLYEILKAKLYGKELPKERISYFREITTKVDDKDVKTYEEITVKDYKLFRQQTDENGEALTHKFEIKVYDKDSQRDVMKVYDTKVPVLDAYKTSITVDPGLIKTAVIGSALSTAIQQFIEKHKILIIIGGAGAFLALVGAYFGYTNQDSISNLCVAQLPAMKNAIINSCSEALRNITVVK